LARKYWMDRALDAWCAPLSGRTPPQPDVANVLEPRNKELVARGVPSGQIVAVGMGSERPLVKPDDTDAKRAKNRRYEVRVRL